MRCAYKGCSTPSEHGSEAQIAFAGRIVLHVIYLRVLGPPQHPRVVPLSPGSLGKRHSSERIAAFRPVAPRSSQYMAGRVITSGNTPPVVKAEKESAGAFKSPEPRPSVRPPFSSYAKAKPFFRDLLAGDAQDSSIHLLL